MGVKQLWPLLRAEGLVEWYRGGLEGEYGTCLSEVDGTAVAVDLAAWLVQASGGQALPRADTQAALLPHFSREERCMKIAFERASALQWLRHGCLPVIVAEGRAPAEKAAAQRARFAARNGGRAGGGTSQGAAQFQKLGATVGGLLETLGLPVFYAPGEAEAVCAALDRAGAVAGCASADGDCLLYGTETVLSALKLSTTQPRECELKRVRMASIRRRLGLTAGGERALCVLAALAGTDYSLDGAQGVGSVGGLAVARHLLQGDTHDGAVIERLAALVQGGHKARIKRHSSKNRCACCPHTENGHCCEAAFERCACAFHRLETERRANIAVFERQRREADAYVERRLAELGRRPGCQLHWLHRPRVKAVFEYLDDRRRQLLWDLPAVRSKLLPVLLEWDLVQQGRAEARRPEGQDSDGEGGEEEVEFRAAAIQKVHGLKAKSDEMGEAHWRYVLTWERVEGADVDGLGSLEVQARKPRAKGAAGGEDDDGPLLVSQAGAATQSPGWQAPPPEVLTLREFDARWMKEQPAEHRAVRISAVHLHLPRLEEAFRREPGKRGRKAAAAAGSGGKAAAGGGVRKPRVGGKAARQLQLGAAEGGAAAAGGAAPAADHHWDDVARYLQQRKPGRPVAAAAAAGKPRASAKAAVAAGRGLEGASGAAAAAVLPRQPAAHSQHLPSFEGVHALLSRGLGGSQQQQQQQPATLLPQQQEQQQPATLLPPQQQQEAPQGHPPPEQRASPQKKARSPGTGPGGSGAAAAAVTAALGSPSDDIEILFSSPDTAWPPARRQQRRPGGSGGVEGADEVEPLPLAQRIAQRGVQAERGQQQEQQQQPRAPGGRTQPMPSPKAAEGSARKLDRKVSSLRRRRSIGGSGELNGAAADADSGRLLVDQPPESRYRSFRVRFVSSIVLIASFLAIIWAGHVPLMFMVLGIQVLMVKELFTLARHAQAERKLPGFRAQQWYFFCVATFWMYIRFIKNNLIVEITSSARLARIFVLTLKKGRYTYQFGQYAWTHMILMVVFVPSSFFVSLLFEGLIWFLLPTALVIVNDIMAYLAGAHAS
ncbi:phosphatidate cytidylyltransferase [Micractinium conductrix]|uniref:phosphatidate cytidylyltransferase n=1 Tax=Micractinium conductrix TaxID=554055 RepID=A0A2P6V008_9CHLO|nr:phosphatidate cytidylyltransferase [Micractinium conductrix]|eukprot:PSC67428.1 phosphatidate cytidylyltransferase [Micractinium conductrix]